MQGEKRKRVEKDGEEDRKTRWRGADPGWGAVWGTDLEFSSASFPLCSGRCGKEQAGFRWCPWGGHTDLVAAAEPMVPRGE